MSLKITRRSLGKTILLDCSGRASKVQEAVFLRDTVRDVVNKGWNCIVLNLAEVSYIDNTGLSELVSAFTYVSARGGSLKLLNLTKRLQELLQIAKLYTIFEVYYDEAKAVASFDDGIASSKV